jgi:hypothetical protein
MDVARMPPDGGAPVVVNEATHAQQIGSLLQGSWSLMVCMPALLGSG